MIEKNIEDYNTNKGVILQLDTDEFCIYNREKHNNKIIGLYTDGIATCSAIVISINNDDILFFGHINEKSNIIEVVTNKLLNEIKTKNNFATIIYSIGKGSLKNPEKEDNIKKMIELLETKFNLEIIEKDHDSSISCLKLIKTSKNENKLLLNNLFEYQKSSLQETLKTKEKFSFFIKKSMDLLTKSIFIEYNLIFYFDSNLMDELAKKFNFVIY